MKLKFFSLKCKIIIALSFFSLAAVIYVGREWEFSHVYLSVQFSLVC